MTIWIDNLLSGGAAWRAAWRAVWRVFAVSLFGLPLPARTTPLIDLDAVTRRGSVRLRWSSFRFLMVIRGFWSPAVGFLALAGSVGAGRICTTGTGLPSFGGPLIGGPLLVRLGLLELG
jgi:hypothetical protein